MTETPDCTQCGACCFGKRDAYITLLPEDAGRAIPADITHLHEKKRYLRMCNGHCAQLSFSASGETLCAIYADRPTVCRAFRAGSFECMKARQHNGPLADAMRRGSVPVVPMPIAEPLDLPAAHMIAPAATRWKPEV